MGKAPADLLEDERVEIFFYKEGVKGLGVYFAIILEMISRNSLSITRTQLSWKKFHGCTRAYVNRVVNDYDLFVDDGFGHISSAIDFLQLNEDTTRLDISPWRF